MRRLMLLRHAKSDWPKGASDHDRPLGPRGRHDAPHMGEEMGLRGLRPDLAVISTARRARETWDLVAPHLGAVAQRFEDGIYEAEPKAILALIRSIDDAVGTLLVVGHNPGLEMTARYLIGGGVERLRDRLGEKF